MLGPDIKQAGLIECIKDLIELIQKGTNLTNIIKQVRRNKKLDPKIKLTIFRIIQEQLNNIIKHANAKKVHILLQKKENTLSLSITDNGKGFDTTKKRLV